MNSTSNLQIIVFGLLFLAICYGISRMAQLKRFQHDAQKLKAEQLAAAKLKTLEHRVEAEKHAALANMYELQAARLEGNSVPTVTLTFPAQTVSMAGPPCGGGGSLRQVTSVSVGKGGQL